MRDVFPHCHLAEHDEIHAMVRRAQLDAMFAQPAERNHAPASNGRVVAICQICDRRSRPVEPNYQGEPNPGMPPARSLAANDPIVPDSMWADEKSNRWLVLAYFAAFFGTLLVCHACARAGS